MQPVELCKWMQTKSFVQHGAFWVPLTVIHTGMNCSEKHCPPMSAPDSGIKNKIVQPETFSAGSKVGLLDHSVLRRAASRRCC